MNFWTFLDRNIAMVVWLAFMTLLFSAIGIHESHGCSVRVGSNSVSVGSPLDGGAP